MPEVLTANFRILTPLFVGGADPNIPEARAASIKAALRHWYRAVDPAAIFAEGKSEPRREELLFGGASEGAGQSPVLVRVISGELPNFDWTRINVNRFNEGSGTFARNGLKYLSYPFHLRGNEERHAIDSGAEFKVTFVQPQRRNSTNGKISKAEVQRAWLASLWLLGSVGSLGTRSRRGFGSLEISNWSAMTANSEWSNEARELPDLWNAKNTQDWRNGFSRGKDTINKWFGSFGGNHDIRFGHPHFGAETSWRMLGGHAEWTVALNQAGRHLQDFRVRRTPDYERVKEALRSGRPLRVTPERAAFGLPLTFRFSSLRDAGTAQFVPRDPQGKKLLERHASLLRFRLVRIGDRLHPLFLRLSGAVPGRDPNANLIKGGRGRQERENLEPASGALLDQFMNQLAEAEG